MGQKLKSPNIRIYTDEAGMKDFYFEILNPPNKSSIRSAVVEKLCSLQEQQLLWGYTKQREEEIEELKLFITKSHQNGNL